MHTINFLVMNETVIKTRPNSMALLTQETPFKHIILWAVSTSAFNFFDATTSGAGKPY